MIDFVLIEQALNEIFYDHKVELESSYHFVIYHVHVVIDKVPALCCDFFPQEIINEESKSGESGQAILTNCIAHHVGEVLAMRWERESQECQSRQSWWWSYERPWSMN